MKNKFKIIVTYFKENGKFYTDTTFEHKFKVVSGGDSCYMYDVVDHVKQLRDADGPRQLPGLSEKGQGWDGYILVDCIDGFPCLILPNKVKSEV